MPEYTISIISDTENPQIQSELREYCDQHAYHLHINSVFPKNVLRKILRDDASEYYIFLSEFVSILNMSKKINLPGNSAAYYCQRDRELDSNMLIMSSETLEKYIDIPDKFQNVAELSRWCPGHVLPENVVICRDQKYETVFHDLSL